jgi:ABC-type sugar transport system substrate-binding protein
MYRRLFAAVLIACALTGTSQVATAAQSRLYLVCAVPDGSDFFIQIESFGGVEGAVHQCMNRWAGLPRGFQKIPS